MSVSQEQTQETKTGRDKKPRKKGMKWLIGAVVVLLFFLLIAMGSSNESEKEQIDKAFQEAFNQSYLLPDELGKDKTVVELLDALCGDESVFYLKQADGMIDVTYQAKTMWMDREADVKFLLELDSENYLVTPISMTLDETEMEPRFMDAFLLQCAGYDTLAQEVLDQWANGQSESYFEEVAAGEEEARKEAERIEEEFLEELGENGITNTNTSTVETTAAGEDEGNMENKGTVQRSLDAAYDFAAWGASDVGSWYSLTTGYFVIPYIDDMGNASVEFATENTQAYYATVYYVDGINAVGNELGGLTYQGIIYPATKEEPAETIGTIELVWDSLETIEFLTVKMSEENQMTDVSMVSDDYVYYGIVDYD